MELPIIVGLIAFLVVLLLLRYAASLEKAGLDKTLDGSNPAAPMPASPSRGVVPLQSLEKIENPADLIAEGTNGSVALYAVKVTIRRAKGLGNFLIHGLKGDKDILLSAITSMQLRPAGSIAPGYIQFAFMGGAEAKRGVLEAVDDENTVLFNQAQQPQFERLKAEVERRIARPQADGASIADELSKLADLRSREMLTADEFASLKRRLLNR